MLRGSNRRWRSGRLSAVVTGISAILDHIVEEGNAGHRRGEQQDVADRGGTAEILVRQAMKA
jgi:hypothetical protein